MTALPEEHAVRRWTTPAGICLICLLAAEGIIVCVLVWYLSLRLPLTTEMVKQGMSVDQVEAVFGKPKWVYRTTPKYPMVSADYTNDGKNFVHVVFKNGRVFRLDEGSSKPN